jgi:hypothetical protein
VFFCGLKGSIPFLEGGVVAGIGFLSKFAARNLTIGSDEGFKADST